MLTAEQLCFFVREGYVICEGLVPPETVRSWHAQVWSSMIIERGDQHALYAAKGGAAHSISAPSVVACQGLFITYRF
jgi:hypothetical protein